MEKLAETGYAISQVIARRWSPRAFGDRPLEVEQIGSLFEAARWAPSCYNDQPWRFIYAARGDAAGFDRALACLVEGNRRWASGAALLILVVHRRTFSRDGKPNRWAAHDTGLATENLVLQAESMGLRAHIMAGIDRDAIRRAYGVPEGFEPITAIAVGWPGDPKRLAEDLCRAEMADRVRRPLDQLVFGGRWDEPAPIAE